MANYHIKKPASITTGDVYFDGVGWTDNYANRKKYTNKTTANTQKATKYTTPHGIEYQPEWWKNSTVVTE